MKILFIYGQIREGEIDDKYVQSFINQLKPKEQFEVFINSPGGNVFQGIAIYNILKPFNPKIKIIGQASSIASIIACAGNVEIAENAVMLIHNPWTITLGDSNYHKKVMEQLETIKSAIIKTYMEKTNKTEKTLSDIMDAETLYDAENAVKNKFADIVFKPATEEDRAIALFQVAALNVENKKLAQEIENSLTNEGDSNMSLEVENTDLKNQVANLTTERDSLKEGTEGLQAKNEELTTNAETLNQEKTDLTKKNEEIQAELDTANKSIEASDEEKKINDVEIFLAKNIRKIKPAVMEDVKAELIVLRNHMDLKIGEVSMYDKHCKSIEALNDLPLDETVADKENPPKVKTKINAETLDFDSNDPKEIKKVNEAIQAKMKENKIDYAEAHEILSNKITEEV